MRHLMFALPAVLLAGCVTKGAMRTERLDAGVMQIYPVAADQAQMAARDIIAVKKWNLRDNKAVDAARWMIMGTENPGSSGVTPRIVRFVIEDRQKECAVWILVRTKLSNAESEAKDAAEAEAFHNELAERLKK